MVTRRNGTEHMKPLVVRIDCTEINISSWRDCAMETELERLILEALVGGTFDAG